jgi:hypothetical protein
MVRALLITLAVLLALAGAATPARAGAEWCDTDPLILVWTPGGQVVPLFVLVGARGLVHFPAAQAASLLATSHTAESAHGGRATRVTVTVIVPDDLFERGFSTRAAVSTGPLGTGKVYAVVEGTSGKAMVLHFTLPIP